MEQEAKSVAEWFHGIFGDRYFIEVMNNNLEIQRLQLEGAVDIANKMGLPVVATSDATILIEGPTGTGKDVLAKVIHHAGKRSKRPLVKVNCAALPDNLLESEMFGYAKGAFTGAEKDKPGRFQEADGGTIFLDEVGELPLTTQVRLLRVLENGEFLKV